MICPYRNKQIHLSRGKARAHLKNLRETSKHGYEGAVYHCAHCGGWHVGRLKRNRKRNKYEKNSHLT